MQTQALPCCFKLGFPEDMSSLEIPQVPGLGHACFSLPHWKPD